MVSGKAFRFIVVLLGFFILVFLFSALFPGKDSLEFIGFEPSEVRVLKVGQPLKIDCKYELHASNKAVAYANFFCKGKAIKIYADSGQSVLIEEPVGTFSLEVFFKEPLQIDEIKLFMNKADTWSVIKRFAASYFDTQILSVSVKTDINVVQ